MRFSFPKQLHADQEFQGILKTEICLLLKMNLITCKVMGWSKGLPELYLICWYTVPRIILLTGKAMSEKYAYPIILACNVPLVTHLSTSCLGGKHITPVDIMYDTVNAATSLQTPGEYATALQSYSITTFEIVQNWLLEAQQRHKDFYNRKGHGDPYKPGDLV